MWLGYCIDLAIHTISIPSDRILSVVQVIDQFVLSTLLVLLENWPSLSVRLFQRVSSLVILLVSHFDILRSPTWDDKISLSRSTLNELCFWKESIPFLNSCGACCLYSPIIPLYVIPMRVLQAAPVIC